VRCLEAEDTSQARRVQSELLPLTNMECEGSSLTCHAILQYYHQLYELQFIDEYDSNLNTVTTRTIFESYWFRTKSILCAQYDSQDYMCLLDRNHSW